MPQGATHRLGQTPRSAGENVDREQQLSYAVDPRVSFWNWGVDSQEGFFFHNSGAPLNLAPFYRVAEDVVNPRVVGGPHDWPQGGTPFKRQMENVWPWTS